MAEHDEYRHILLHHAKKHLVPIGCFRRGPRIWVLDQGYWLALVEFVPHKWEKGTFMNVVAHWLWSNKEGHFSFDYGGRVNGFFLFENAKQFELVAENLTKIAANSITKLRDECNTIQKISKLLLMNHPESGWPAYHAGIAAALAGELGVARSLLLQVPIGHNEEIEWQRSLCQDARELAKLVASPDLFKARMQEIVKVSRVRHKLPPMAINFDA